MNRFIEKLEKIIHQYWRNEREHQSHSNFLDRILARRYYKKKHAWYEKTYWEWYTGNDIFRPNGIMGDNKEHLFTKAHIVLEHINADGNIMDFWCGNGLLLKVIQEKSNFKLTPHWVDFLGKSINQAREHFPENQDNFLEQNIIDYESATLFRYILSSPWYIRKRDFKNFLERCIFSLEEGWKILFFSTPDNLDQLEERLVFIEKHTWRKIIPQHRLWIHWILLEKENLK